MSINKKWEQVNRKITEQFFSDHPQYGNYKQIYISDRYPLQGVNISFRPMISQLFLTIRIRPFKQKN
jgi:hypothetical protein